MARLRYPLSLLWSPIYTPKVFSINNGLACANGGSTDRADAAVRQCRIRRHLPTDSENIVVPIGSRSASVIANDCSAQCRLIRRAPLPLPAAAAVAAVDSVSWGRECRLLIEYRSHTCSIPMWPKHTIWSYANRRRELIKVHTGISAEAQNFKYINMILSSLV